ncbi:hypothetical protein Ahy_A02g008837 isoform B [Arachis hypogaea]|uniref:G protein gamma domain-containing protein n=1 Tax=Arachis hypogaea TaxID=3818 RepID=A0A445EFJ3_ARAHY|nr:hypothetical protein Ahy_A02g008837 isoform B [Arachis hypogaea]
MASETASSADEETVVVPVSAEGARGIQKQGKHRILADLKRLEQDSKFLQCSLLKSMDTKPDPLLPEINGPVNLLWDRWFEGPQDPQSCQCRIV